jgi:HK97 family phage portal protein
MFHLCGFSTDGITGVNPIQLHRESIGLAMATEEHGARLFSNGAKMGGILRHPQRFKDVETGRRVAQSFDAATSGSNAHRTVVLEEGMEWQQITMNSEDAQFLQTRQYQVEDIARIFRVPPVLIGYSDKASTYASAEQFFLSFVTHTMTPWFVRWEQAIQRDLINEGEQLTHFAEFIVNGLLRGDSQARSDFYTKMFNVGAYSQNDIRAKENENPIEGGDKYFVPLNMSDSSGIKAIPPAQGE